MKREETSGVTIVNIIGRPQTISHFSGEPKRCKGENYAWGERHQKKKGEGGFGSRTSPGHSQILKVKKKQYQRKK